MSHAGALAGPLEEQNSSAERLPRSPPPPAPSRPPNPGGPQTAALGLRRPGDVDNNLPRLSLPSAIVLDLTLPLASKLRRHFPRPLEDPLALDLSRRFPLEPLASKPSPRFRRRTPPRTGRWQQRMLQITKQPRIGEHPVHRAPPNAGGLAVKSPYDLVPPDGGKQSLALMRSVQDRRIAPDQPPQMLRIHTEILGRLFDSAETPA